MENARLAENSRIRAAEETTQVGEDPGDGSPAVRFSAPASYRVRTLRATLAP